MKSTFRQEPVKSYKEIKFWALVAKLWPYLKVYKIRVSIALALLVAAKVVGFGMPWALGKLVDTLDSPVQQLLAVPVGLVLLYGAMRFGSVLLGELRDAVFSRVTESAMRKIGLEVFAHLHQLDLEFHQSRQTGGISRDIDRGTNGISFMMRFLVFNILPTIIELILVILFLLWQFDIWFSIVTVASIVVYVVFSAITTEWRTGFVKEANRLDSKSNTRAIDSLINYETVKYFNNEHFEAEKYNDNLKSWELARIKNRLSLAFLNSGQALIIAVGLTLMVYLSAQNVVSGNMTIGELVMVNGFLMQLFIPLNALGFIYREIRRALSDIENMFELLDRPAKVVDQENAQALQVTHAQITFDNVSFSYKKARAILQDLSFQVASGHKVAIVGASGSGKSTIGRLLFRFYDIDKGTITIDGQAIDQTQQFSLRQNIGVVPQDTVLFNDTIWANVAYGCPDADDKAVWHAIEMANLKDFITDLPDGVDTLVGERGLKVSGGEKQRIAIARVLLKNPAILLFDEATSALDSKAEQSILKALAAISYKRTTLVIAHRLSTIVDADNILVIDKGRLIEQGTHQQLLAADGHYAQLWTLQQQSLNKQS